MEDSRIRKNSSKDSRADSPASTRADSPASTRADSPASTPAGSRSTASENIVTLTPTATIVLREKLAAESSRLGVSISGMRLSLRSGGCAGMSYEMSYALTPQANDIRQDSGDITLYIDPLATMFLLGTVIDHRRDKLSSGFTFTSPRATARCGCGESVAFG